MMTILTDNQISRAKLKPTHHIRYLSGVILILEFMICYSVLAKDGHGDTSSTTSFSNGGLNITARVARQSINQVGERTLTIEIQAKNGLPATAWDFNGDVLVEGRRIGLALVSIAYGQTITQYCTIPSYAAAGTEELSIVPRTVTAVQVAAVDVERDFDRLAEKNSRIKVVAVQTSIRDGTVLQQSMQMLDLDSTLSPGRVIYTIPIEHRMHYKSLPKLYKDGNIVLAVPGIYRDGQPVAIAFFVAGPPSMAITIDGTKQKTGMMVAWEVRKPANVSWESQARCFVSWLGQRSAVQVPSAQPLSRMVAYECTGYETMDDQQSMLILGASPGTDLPAAPVQISFVVQNFSPYTPH
jgi:hypothetical protein